MTVSSINEVLHTIFVAYETGTLLNIIRLIY